jgi:hypothetical protein
MVYSSIASQSYMHFPTSTLDAREDTEEISILRQLWMMILPRRPYTKIILLVDFDMITLIDSLNSIMAGDDSGTRT